MPEELSGHSTGSGRDRMTAGAIGHKFSIRRDPIRWLILCGVLLIAGIAIGTAVMVGNFRERALDNSKHALENTVLLLAQHFDQRLEDFGAIQADLIAYMQSSGIDTSEFYRRRMSSPDIHLMLKARIGALSYVGGVNLFDSEGTLINSSGAWPVPAVNVADRAYFKAFKSDPQSPSVLVEAVNSRITGAWTTVLARKLTGRNGEFLGAIGRGIEPSHFENFLASVALGKDAEISMVHRDGTLLARYPHAESMIGQNFKSGPMFQYILSKGGNATGSFKSPLDGQDRLEASHSLSRFPILVIATTTVSAALADWREQTRFLVGVAGLSAFVIAIILVLIVRQLTRQHRLEKHRLDTAINNMTQGLLLFDSAGRLVVCNDSYIEMYGLSQDVVKRGCSFRDLIAHRKATGSFEGDLNEYCSNILRDIARGTINIMQTVDGRSIQVANQPVADGGWVATHEDITERRRSEERIVHLAHYDALTDLPNRVLFREQLERELKRIARGGQLAVLYIDIDEFKYINDSLGHPTGDELLKAVAARLRGCIRDTDFVCRLGGDEFAIVQTAVEQPADITDLVTRVHAAIREPYECLGHQITTDASIGIAVAPEDGTDLDQLLKNADLAMYGAKADGRRTYRFFEPDMDARLKTRRALEQELRVAIADGRFTNGGFELHYQPLVSLRDDKVTGCEALLRWRHPERGMISPAEFIPVVEESGLISQLGEWVLTTACAEAATWPDNIKIAVNVSPVQFRNHALALKVAAALAASGLPASRLELEITEAVLIRDDDAALAILHQLRAIGVQIALDDFGTGYSSLSYLQRFPFDKIKIDRCFVKDIVECEGSASIVQAVVNIAAARNMTTTAEGVETEPQREVLRALGCTEMQGYLFSAAKPAADIRKLLRNKRKTAAA
jgi:diguanylate cyclase (GGDEF)-like protein/PAS domain S-box-containing protein